MSIELGTVGWDSEDSWYVQGTANDAGTTLVRVQLFRGRDTSKPLNAAIGQGAQLLCQISSGLFHIPDKGTRCYVAIPEAMGDIPAMPIIIATVEKNPLLQYNQDRSMITFGDEKHIVIRGKSVTIAAPGGQFIMVGTSRAGGNPSVLIQDETGSGLAVQGSGVCLMSSHGGGSTDAVLQLTGAGIEMFEPQGGSLSIKSGGWIGVGITATLQAAAVYLGSAPTAANGVAYGATGPVNLFSLGVFVSPV